MASSTGTITQIACCDWLPERARWSYLACWELPAVSRSNFHQKPYIKSFFAQVCSAKMAGYWPRSFFLFFFFLRVSVVSVHKDAKKNLANIQPYFMASIVRALLLAAERALFSCNEQALWIFFLARRLFWVVTKTTCVWAKTTEKMDKVQLYF